MILSVKPGSTAILGHAILNDKGSRKVPFRQHLSWDLHLDLTADRLSVPGVFPWRTAIDES